MKKHEIRVTIDSTENHTEITLDELETILKNEQNEKRRNLR
jgi:hypothetical protein